MERRTTGPGDSPMLTPVMEASMDSMSSSVGTAPGTHASPPSPAAAAAGATFTRETSVMPTPAAAHEASAAPSGRQPTSVAVVGLGRQGTLIAADLAIAGAHVVAVPTIPPSADAGAGARPALGQIDAWQVHLCETAIKDAIHDAASSGLITDEEERRAAGRVRVANSIAGAVAGAPWVVEASKDEVEVKRAVLAAIEASCPRGCVITTNSLNIALRELQAMSAAPEYLLTARFLHPVVMVPPVEVVTSPEAASGRAALLVRRMLAQYGHVPFTGPPSAYSGGSASAVSEGRRRLNAAASGMMQRDEFVRRTNAGGRVALPVPDTGAAAGAAAGGAGGAGGGAGTSLPTASASAGPVVVPEEQQAEDGAVRVTARPQFPAVPFASSPEMLAMVTLRSPPEGGDETADEPAEGTGASEAARGGVTVRLTGGGGDGAKGAPADADLVGEPQEESEAGSGRPPVTVCVVLDVSSSMSGDKLALCKTTLRVMVAELRSIDYVCLVTYGNEAAVRTRTIRMDTAGRAALVQAVDSVAAHGCTNLSGGLFTGLDVLAGRQVLPASEAEEGYGVGSAWAQHGFGATRRPKSAGRGGGDGGGDSKAANNATPVVATSGDVPRGTNNNDTKGATAGGSVGGGGGGGGGDGDDGETARASEAAVMEGAPTPVSAVLLLTDGMANRGMRSTGSIVRALESWYVSALPGVSVHCFGYGRDHNSDMLQRIASAMDGVYFFVENEDAIASAFAECMGALMTVSALEVELELRAVRPLGAAGASGGAAAPTACRITEVLSANAVALEPGTRYRVKIGALAAEQRRDILVRVRLPELTAAAAHADAKAIIEAVITYRNPLTDPSGAGARARVVARIAVARPGEADMPAAQPLDVEMLENVHRVDAAAALVAATRAGERGDFARGRALLQELAERIRASGVDLRSPATAQVLRDLDRGAEGLRDARSYSWGHAHCTSSSMAHHTQRSTHVDGGSYSTTSQTTSRARWLTRTATESAAAAAMAPPAPAGPSLSRACAPGPGYWGSMLSSWTGTAASVASTAATDAASSLGAASSHK